MSPTATSTCAPPVPRSGRRPTAMSTASSAPSGPAGELPPRRARLARKLGPGRTIVTVLCDPGSRYQSRLYNPEFLRSKGLSPPDWLVQPQRLEPDFVEIT